MAGTVFFSVTMSLDGFIAPEERMDDTATVAMRPASSARPDMQRWMAQWMELQQWMFAAAVLPGEPRDVEAAVRSVGP